MTKGVARAIFEDINRPDFSDIEKGTAIKIVLDMETHNSVTKDSMLQVIRYLWDMCFTEDRGE
jgi:hypothetical protein